MRHVLLVLLLLLTVPFTACIDTGSDGGNRPPTAVIRYDGPLMTGKTIWFYSDQSSDPDGDQLSYHWSFGDGATWPTRNTRVYHQYQDPGTYTVTLVVSDGELTDKTTVEITIAESPNRRPDAHIDEVGMVFLDEDSGTVDVRFDGTASSDPDGDEMWYTWDFDDETDLNGDGVGWNDAEASGSVVHHTFNETGDFNVTLTVTDGELNDTARSVVYVRWPTPKADLESENHGALGFEIWIHNVTRTVPLEDVKYYIVRDGQEVASGNVTDSGDDVVYRDDDLDGNLSSEDNIGVGTSVAQAGDDFILTYGPNEMAGETRGGADAEIGRTTLPE